MRLTEEEFINGVCTLEKMYKQEAQVIKALDICEWVPSNWISEYYALFSSLCELPEDPVAGSDLDYFIYELDFGRKWKPGMVRFDGKDIPLRTPKELWDYIHICYKNEDS